LSGYQSDGIFDIRQHFSKAKAERRGMYVLALAFHHITTSHPNNPAVFTMASDMHPYQIIYDPTADHHPLPSAQLRPPTRSSPIVSPTTTSNACYHVIELPATTSPMAQSTVNQIFKSIPAGAIHLMDIQDYQADYQAQHIFYQPQPENFRDVCNQIHQTFNNQPYASNVRPQTFMVTSNPRQATLYQRPEEHTKARPDEFGQKKKIC
jgi:hypothetical protein